MKRSFLLFLSIAMCSSLLVACGKEKEEEVIDGSDTTEQVAFDDVEVEDYTVLKYNELEVLAYEGDTDAQVQLGRMLEYGTEDVKQDFPGAISWYQMASDSGNVDGTCALGYFYLTGTGVDQDLEKANELFDKAIEEGCVNANVGKARVLLTQLQNSEESEESVEDEEFKTVFDLFYKAQISGDLDGGYYLGYAYENGIGTAVDYKKAFDYYSRVAKSASTDLSDQYATVK